MNGSCAEERRVRLRPAVFRRTLAEHGRRVNGTTATASDAARAAIAAAAADAIDSVDDAAAAPRRAVGGVVRAVDRSVDDDDAPAGGEANEYVRAVAVAPPPPAAPPPAAAAAIAEALRRCRTRMVAPWVGEARIEQHMWRLHRSG